MLEEEKGDVGEIMNCSGMEKRHSIGVGVGKNVSPVREQQLNHLHVSMLISDLFKSDLQRRGLVTRLSSLLLGVCAVCEQLAHILCPSADHCRPKRGVKKGRRWRRCHFSDSGANSFLENRGGQDRSSPRNPPAREESLRGVRAHTDESAPVRDVTCCAFRQISLIKT